jgi:hypothetical protein
MSAFISGVGKKNENPSKVSLSYLKILGARRMCNEASFVLRIPITLNCDKSVTTQNLVFLSYWNRKKRLQMYFNRYSVITQFAKLTAGEQLCCGCTHRKL